MAKSEFKDRLKKTEEIELTVTGRASGDKSSRPVWFVEEDGKLYLLPVKGSDTEWYKNVLKKPEITLNADGQQLTKRATPITDRAKVDEIVEKFRAKYGANNVKKYYTKFDVARSRFRLPERRDRSSRISRRRTRASDCESEA
jgi:hypothetical protein